jgi:hypothetical protein
VDFHRFISGMQAENTVTLATTDFTPTPGSQVKWITGKALERPLCALEGLRIGLITGKCRAPTIVVRRPEGLVQKHSFPGYIRPEACVWALQDKYSVAWYCLADR